MAPLWRHGPVGGCSRSEEQQLARAFGVAVGIAPTMPSAFPFPRTPLVDKIMETANVLAGGASGEVCGPEHILLALSREGMLSREALAVVGISEQSLFQKLEDNREQRHDHVGLPEPAPPLEALLETMGLAEREARKFGSHVLGEEHLLLALLDQPDPFIARIVGSAQRSTLRATVIQLMSGYRQVGERPEDQYPQREGNGSRYIQSDHRERIPMKKRKDLVSHTGTGARVAAFSIVVVVVVLVHQRRRTRAALASD